MAIQAAVEETVLLADLIEANVNKLAGAGNVDRNLIKSSFALKDGHREEVAKEHRLLGLSGSSNKLTTRRGTDADWRSISECLSMPPVGDRMHVRTLTAHDTTRHDTAHEWGKGQNVRS
jgi:hypothetical protein